ncbi:hypothetical protein [Botrimarina mediterranea]|uniref:hypothetical protein n=1 Tax=Botrimarina mediterranea TaxID=2528022 RepID=UPI001188A4E5|nr:hypothetical protein K2D_45970 [Planctomycetes bacterium K2D]
MTLLTHCRLALATIALTSVTIAPASPSRVSSSGPQPLAESSGAAPEDKSPGSDDSLVDLVRVFACQFDDASWDINYDSWPDRWTRVYDDEHPQYARIAIVPADDEATSGKVLLIQPDGAGATAISPPIHVMPKFSYKLRMRARIKGVEHGAVRVRMAFHNSRDIKKQVEQSDPLPSDGRWRDIEMGDYQPEDGEVDRVYLHLDYARGERGDLNAEIQIADVRLYRLPSIRIHTDSLYNVYTNVEDVEVTCSLSGILEQNPEVRFQLLDATNKSIGEGGKVNLDGQIISESVAHASDIVDGFGTDKSSYEGSKAWKPPIKDYGFYRVRVGMYRTGTDVPIGETRAISVAVVRDALVTSERGEFGWTLPKADRPLPFSVLQELLPRVGVRKVKLPVWFVPGDEQRGESIMKFAEQLAARGIETIGILEDPSLVIADPRTQKESPPIEGFLSGEPSYWLPQIDHIITRLSLRIRWWQLGRDGDTSFVGYDRLVERIGAIRNQLFRFGQDVRMGIGWRWDHPRDKGKSLSWDFEQLAGREALDAAGLESAFDKARPSSAERWVVVAPPEVDMTPPEGADPDDPNDPLMRAAFVRRHQERVRDFVKQILVAKMNGADGIFISNPFSGSPDMADGQTGVMNTDGSPGELLLPWRTCARLLGGAKYLGSIRLPHGSNNWIFKRTDGQVVMVLWNLEAPTTESNDTPVEETLYLGENVQVIDVWGDDKRPEQRDGRQVIRVGQMPLFVYGLHEGIARWRMEMGFESKQVASVFGVQQQNALLLHNTFGQGVGGTVRVFVPEQGVGDESMSEVSSSSWNVSMDDPRLSMKTNESLKAPLTIGLDDASFGPQIVRCEFEISAERDYKFSVWRELFVGLDNISLEVETFLTPEGALVVEQRMTNTGELPVDLKCTLHASNSHRRPKRAQVFQLESDVDKKRYKYINADDLIGKTMRLQVEETAGQRELIYRFKVEPKLLDDSEEATLTQAL